MQTGDGTSRGRRRVSPAMVLAVAALIASLAGSAVAIDQIGSNDIKRNAVRSKHIKAGQVKPEDGDVVRFARAASEVTHDSAVDADLGPRVRFRAKAGDLLHVHVAVTSRLVSGTPGEDCRVRLRVQGPPGDFDRTVIQDNAGDPITVYMDSATGTTNLADQIGRDIPIPSSGRYTVSLRYQSTPGTTCGFANRRLWVEHSR